MRRRVVSTIIQVKTTDIVGLAVDGRKLVMMRSGDQRFRRSKPGFCLCCRVSSQEVLKPRMVWQKLIGLVVIKIGPNGNLVGIAGGLHDGLAVLHGLIDRFPTDRSVEWQRHGSVVGQGRLKLRYQADQETHFVLNLTSSELSKAPQMEHANRIDALRSYDQLPK